MKTIYTLIDTARPEMDGLVFDSYKEAKKAMIEQGLKDWGTIEEDRVEEFEGEAAIRKALSEGFDWAWSVNSLQSLTHAIENRQLETTKARARNAAMHEWWKKPGGQTRKEPPVLKEVRVFHLRGKLRAGLYLARTGHG